MCTVHDVEVSEARYEYLCRRCGTEWTEAVEVHRGRDVVGEEFVTYAVRGLPCAAPEARCCPSCGGYRVRVLPGHDVGHEVGGGGPEA